jgi:valyl-tRNA synthetase
MNVLIPMSGLIDKAAESARLTKEIGKLRQEAERMAQAKLGQRQFYRSRAGGGRRKGTRPRG